MYYELSKYGGYKQAKEFIRDVLPEKYRGAQGQRWTESSWGKYVDNFRLVLGAKHNLPTYETILKHPFFSSAPKKNPVVRILKKVLPSKKKKAVAAPRPPQPPVRSGSANQSSAIRRAVAVLQKNAEKKKMPLKRPGVARVKSPNAAPVATKQRPKISINKNGNTKIDRRKCRLYKKGDLAKMFNLDPKLTKDQMCRLIKNM